MSRFVVACALSLFAAPSFAQDAFQHHLAMIDIAATPPWDYGDEGGDDDGPPYSNDEWRRWSEQPPIRLDQETIETIAKYRAFADGRWFHGESGNGPNGKACVATFMREHSGAMVMALGGENDWALLGFFGPAAPRPAELETVQVTLEQTGEKPAKVSAFNLALPWAKDFAGLVVFAVPTAKAALEGMLDSQMFEVQMQGKPVARVTWADGLAARDELSKCIANRSKG